MEKIRKWIASHSDKLAHFLVSAMLVSLFAIIVGLIWATIIAILLGITKEVLDKIKGGKFDLLDLLADALGIIYIVIYTLVLTL